MFRRVLKRGEYLHYEENFTRTITPLQIIKYTEKKQQHTRKIRRVVTLAKSHPSDLESFKNRY